MGEPNLKDTIGNLKVSEEVLATIAKMAAGEVKGVAQVTCENSNIKGRWAKAIRRNPVGIELNGDIATVNICLDLYQGVSIPDVSLAVQNSVKSAIQSMTGITVSKVNIVVQGIAFESESGEEH